MATLAGVEVKNLRVIRAVIAYDADIAPLKKIPESPYGPLVKLNLAGIDEEAYQDTLFRIIAPETVEHMLRQHPPGCSTTFTEEGHDQDDEDDEDDEDDQKNDREQVAEEDEEKENEDMMCDEDEDEAMGMIF